MGVLGATTIRKLQDFSELPEVHGKEPGKLQQYIDRAEAVLAYMGSYDVSLPDCVPNLEMAVNMLAENLIVLRTPTFMRSQLAQFKSETIGSYSYTRETGITISNSIFTGITEEIMALLGACKISGSGIRYSRTNVFVPRTFSLPSFPNEKFYVPEDERVIEGTVVIDPSDPRHR